MMNLASLSSSLSSSSRSFVCTKMMTPEHQNDEPPPPPPPYTLRDHCRHLDLKTDDMFRWYCDWSAHFVQPKLKECSEDLKRIVVEYCQPIPDGDIQAKWVGLKALSLKRTRDPLPVRTVAIRIRPDVKQFHVMEAVHEAFSALHNQHYHVLHSTMNEFQAIGADGAEPFFLDAAVGTHQTSLERRLWIRVYHVQDSPTLMEDVLQKIGGISKQKSPLGNFHTPLNTKLAEACVVVQHILHDHLLPSDPSPGTNQQETTEWFQTTYSPSPSVKAVNNPSSDKDVPVSNTVFPSLSKEDYGILQESYPLLDRIWSELEWRKATYNTLMTESSRFGMRPCQPTLDKDYCWHLAQISQLRMLGDLQHDLEQAETVLHNSLNDYHELEQLLIQVLRNTYRIPVKDTMTASSSRNLDIGQAPIALPQRKFADFPWNNTVKQALDDVSHRIAAACLKAFDPPESFAMADEAVHHVFTNFGTCDDADHKQFLKQQNRQAMIRLAQRQSHLKNLLAKFTNGKSSWGSLPHVAEAVDKWTTIGNRCQKVTRFDRNAIPILEFQTKFGGMGCLTPHQMVLMQTSIQNKFLSSMMTTVYVLDWKNADVKATPNHPLSKLTILENGIKVTGCHPIGVNVDQLVKFIHILKSLQD